MNPRHLLLVSLILVASTLAGVQDALAGWPGVRIEATSSFAKFSPIADFLRFESEGTSGIPEARSFDYEDLTLTGFRVALRVHPTFELGWTRQWGTTQLQFDLDGTSLSTGDFNDGSEIAVPEFDLRYDLLSGRWWPESTRWRGVFGPVLEAGAFLLRQDQNGDFAPDSLVRQFDWSGTDKGVMFAVGLQGRWGMIDASVLAEGLSYYFEPPIEDVEGREIPERVPRETVLGLLFSAHLSIGF